MYTLGAQLGRPRIRNMVTWSEDSGVLVHPKLHQYCWKGCFVQMVCFFLEAVRHDSMGFSDGGVWFYSGQHLYSMCFSPDQLLAGSQRNPEYASYLKTLYLPIIQSSRCCNPEGPRTQIIGFEGANTNNSIVSGP